MRKNSWNALALTLLISLGPCGCSGLRQEVRTCASPVPRRTVGHVGAVFVVDGAGRSHAATNSIQKVIEASRVPLDVQWIDWSHGDGRFLADQVDAEHARQAGWCLACRIVAYRRAFPGYPITLVGYSAGSAVTLAAAELLPPGSLERIVLLAPSVSNDYDLRPALRSSRQGVDCFYSERDIFYLGIGIGIVGTADRQWTAAAGRVGFTPVICQPADAFLYSRLRQHAWCPAMSELGHLGGHYGSYQPEFLRAYVLALLIPAPPPLAPGPQGTPASFPARTDSAYRSSPVRPL